MKTVTASSAGRPATPIELVCLDMAGTTVADDGAVAAAFAAALDELGVAAGAERRRMNAYVRDTMGTSKIEVFRALFDGEQRARSANEAFEAAYDATVRRGWGAAAPRGPRVPRGVAGRGPAHRPHHRLLTADP